MIRRPPRSTRTDTLFPYTTLFRSWPETAARVPYRARRFEVSAGVSYLAVLPGSFARRLHTGEHALAIGHGRVERGERRAGAGFNGIALTLARHRGTARAGHGAGERGSFVRSEERRVGNKGVGTFRSM